MCQAFERVNFMTKFGRHLLRAKSKTCILPLFTWNFDFPMCTYFVVIGPGFIF